MEYVIVKIGSKLNGAVRVTKILAAMKDLGIEVIRKDGKTYGEWEIVCDE